MFEQLDRIEARLIQFQSDQEKKMAAIDDQITALTAEVARNTTVEKSALALINGFSAQLTAAVNAALAAGATPAQLTALTTLGTSLKANDDELAAAVAANTPVTNPVTPKP